MVVSTDAVVSAVSFKSAAGTLLVTSTSGTVEFFEEIVVSAEVTLSKFSVVDRMLSRTTFEVCCVVCMVAEEALVDWDSASNSKDVSFDACAGGPVHVSVPCCRTTIKAALVVFGCEVVKTGSKFKINHEVVVLAVTTPVVDEIVEFGAAAVDPIAVRLPTSTKPSGRTDSGFLVTEFSKPGGIVQPPPLDTKAEPITCVHPFSGIEIMSGLGGMTVKFAMTNSWLPEPLEIDNGHGILNPTTGLPGVELVVRIFSVCSSSVVLLVRSVSRLSVTVSALRPSVVRVAVVVAVVLVISVFLSDTGDAVDVGVVVNGIGFRLVHNHFGNGLVLPTRCSVKIFLFVSNDAAEVVDTADEIG